MAKQYDDNSIKALKGEDRVRLRPGVMLGTDDVNGAFHTVAEIVGNSEDEAREGYGGEIIVHYHADRSVSVQDFGRGVPMGWNEKEQAWNWHLIFNELYAGGKYRDLDNVDITNLNPSDLSHYTIGLNGVGSAATQYTSAWMTVVSRRPDGVYTKHFKKGKPTEEELLVEPNETGETGTLIHWLPDREVFRSIDFTFNMFKSYLESQAYINVTKITYIDDVHNNGEPIIYIGEGIREFLEMKVKEDNILDIFEKSTSMKGYEDGKPYLAKADLVLAITNELPRSVYMHHHNTGVMSVGVHHPAFESAVEKFFKNIGSEHGVKITPYDYNGYISVLTSSYSTLTSFANQTKTGVSNTFVFDMIYNLVLNTLEEALAMQNEAISTLVHNVVVAAQARLRAKELEKQERMISKITNSKSVVAGKYVPCRSEDPNVKELFIVEGDSAMTACKSARDSSFQAILPVKGKPLNALKHTIKKILGNQEVQDIIATIGAGADIEGVNAFDLDKVQFSKIIITTDADVDGLQIRVLIYTIFYRLFPTLLKKGYVYIAESPLFEVVTSKGNTFAYSVEEKDQVVEEYRKNGAIVKKINRFKGLGETDADLLWESTMNPETRRLVQLSIDVSDTLVRDITNMLFGTDVGNERKEFILSLLDDKLGDAEILEGLMETLDELDDSPKDFTEEEELEVV